MIKFTGSNATGRTIYGFGLSKMNIEKLKQGLPIHVDLEPMGGKGAVVIVYGRTEKALYEKLKTDGLIRPETEIHETEFDEHGTPLKRPTN